MTSHLPASEVRTQLRLTSADFDANLASHFFSDASRRARVELRQRMLAWARRVVARLAAMDVGLEVAGSDERATMRNGRRVDAQRVLFWREPDARAELESRFGRARPRGAPLDDADACLALTVDEAAVEVAIELPSDAGVDVRNVRARLVDPARSLELAHALESLPEQFAVGLAGEERDQEAQRADAQAMMDLLDRGAAGNEAVWLGWCVPREVVVKHSALLDEQLEDAMVALGFVYKLLAWAPDNDLLASAPRVDRRDPARARARQGRALEDDAALDSERGRRREPHDRTKRPAKKAAVRDVAPSALPDRPALRPGKRPILRATIRALRPVARVKVVGSPGASAPHPSEPPILERGARVRVLAGPFVGKVGVLQELDGKGGARVMLGLLATRVAVKDLAASSEGRERPSLSTSHRKVPLRGA